MYVVERILKNKKIMMPRLFGAGKRFALKGYYIYKEIPKVFTFKE